MRFRLTFITSISLILFVFGAVLTFRHSDGPVHLRYFCIVVGTLGWAIGNQLADLEDRIAELEKGCEKKAESST